MWGRDGSAVTATSSKQPPSITTEQSPQLRQLRASGVSVVIKSHDRRLPVVLHWGADPGQLSDAELSDLARAAVPPYGDSPFDVANQISVLPEHASAWIGRPGLEGSRHGRDW